MIMKVISKYWLIISMVVIYILALLCYGNSLRGGFVFDDANTIVYQKQLRNINNVFDIWDSYKSRFIPYITFALNYKINQLNPFGYHLVNFALHILNSAFVFYLTSLILKSPGISKIKNKNTNLVPIIAAGIFVIHPIQTQAVNFISQRITLVASLFYFLTLIFYLYYRLSNELKTKTIYFCLCVLSFVCSLFSKENSYTLSIVILMTELILFSGKIYSKKKLVLQFLPFLLIPMFIFSLTYLGNSASPINTIVSLNMLDEVKITRSEYFFTELNVIRKYLSLLLFPISQNVDYDFPIAKNFFEVSVIFSALLISTLIYFAYVLRKKKPLLSFGILFFFAALLIESTLIPIKDVIFEHRLYLPSFGFILACISICQNLKKRNLLILTILILGVFSMLTVKRNRVWLSEYSLWKDTVNKSPKKPRVHYNLGVASYGIGKTEEAKKAFKNTIALDPGYNGAYRNLAEIYRQENNYSQAIELLKRAIQISSEDKNLKASLASVFAKKGDYNQAISVYKGILDFDPENALVYNDLGLVYFMQDDRQMALSALQKAIELDPKYEIAYLNLANLYFQFGDDLNAIKYYKKTLEINPKNDQALEHLK